MLKKYKSWNSALRNTVLLKKNHLTKIKKLKNKLKFKTNNAGRNKTGKITAFKKGKINKKLNRNLNYNFINDNTTNYLIEAIEYTPKLSTLIMRIYNPQKKIHFYILAIQNLYIGNIIQFNPSLLKNLGDNVELKYLNIGTPCNSIRNKKKLMPLFTRAAGTSSLIIQQTKNKTLIQLPSKKFKWVHNNFIASVGILANAEHILQNIGKAGRSLKYKGIKPKVRGVAMNPIDHPHGGGEGKTSGGRPSVTPWGLPTKGLKTRKK